MADKTETAFTLLQILIAIGAFKGIEMFVKYLINRKKDKTKSIGDMYKEFAENTDKYIKQTEDMQNTITDLRNESLCMGKRLIEMDKKLDLKNQIIISLKQEVHELTEKTKQNTKVINELLEESKYLNSIKCEREPCDNRIPPKKSIKIGKAKA